MKILIASKVIGSPIRAQSLAMTWLTAKIKIVWREHASHGHARLIQPLRLVDYTEAMKRVRMARPASWLFSGWNCVASRFSRPTHEQNSRP